MSDTVGRTQQPRASSGKAQGGTRGCASGLDDACRQAYGGGADHTCWARQIWRITCLRTVRQTRVAGTLGQRPVPGAALSRQNTGGSCIHAAMPRSPWSTRQTSLGRMANIGKVSPASRGLKLSHLARLGVPTGANAEIASPPAPTPWGNLISGPDRQPLLGARPTTLCPGYWASWPRSNPPCLPVPPTVNPRPAEGRPCPWP